jgi:crossover junction endodeoxyribonuclease RusA
VSASITIPMCPPRQCWPNWRGHWAAKVRTVALWREAAGWASKAAVLADPEAFAWVSQAPVIGMDVVIAWPKGQRRLDNDNAWASLKAMHDGIADALGIDDRHFRQGNLVQTHGEGIVTVTVWEGVA